MSPQLNDPYYALQGNPKQYPRYATHAWRADGYADCIAVAQFEPKGDLYRIMADGSRGKIVPGFDMDRFLNAHDGRSIQVSMLFIAARIHAKTKG